MNLILQAVMHALGMVYRAVRSLPPLAADTLLVLLKHPPQQANLICLVRLDNIGDFFIWLDSARQMREFYRDKKIILLANRAFSDFAETLPYWDKVVPVDVAKLQRSPLYRWRMFSKLRNIGAETTIQPVYSRVMLTGDAAVRILGARNRIGSAGDLSNMARWEKRLADHWYTCLVPAAIGNMMELDRNAEFLRGLGMVPGPVSVASLPGHTGSEITSRLISPYFVLFPGATWSGRIWPANYFVQCADQIYGRYGWQAIICGGYADMENAEVIRHGINSHQALNMAGRTSLPELVELIRRAELIVGNESSGVHIAAAVGTPSICVLGGGHFGRFVPYSDSAAGSKPVGVFHAMPCYGCNWRCNQPHVRGAAVPCIQQVSVQEVMAAIDRALQ